MMEFIIWVVWVFYLCFVIGFLLDLGFVKACGGQFSVVLGCNFGFYGSGGGL